MSVLHSLYTKVPGGFQDRLALEKLRHYLPSQAPLKDFIHHNTLHAFQDMPFHEACHRASNLFGYKTRLYLEEFREMYSSGRIRDEILNRVIRFHKGDEQFTRWKNKMTDGHCHLSLTPRVGELRKLWKQLYRVNLDKAVHPLLFRLAGNYLDQGIATWQFPLSPEGFLDSVRKLQDQNFSDLFRSKRVIHLLQQESLQIRDLLSILVGKEEYFERYLFDQQFAHPGWSGMVSVLEEQPQTLLDSRPITLHDFILVELLLEIDHVDRQLGSTHWTPLGNSVHGVSPDLFELPDPSEDNEILSLWQEALEWSYYDQVIGGIALRSGAGQERTNFSFQALFCIDDRECSLRRYIEKQDPDCYTYGTPGFFNAAFYFKPEHGHFLTKVCPAPIQPTHVILETESENRHRKDALATDHSNGWLTGWIVSQTLGLWSGLRLISQLFRPSETRMMVSSFQHMDQNGKLSVEHEGHFHGEYQVGFTAEEMADRVEGLLRSIGLVKYFAPIVYLIGHGASSLNNTYYAGYDCGACSGRPGSVNARVMALMANHPAVRKLLEQRGIAIPAATQFLGGLHDTTRDEMEFYDQDVLSTTNAERHQKNLRLFRAALDDNSKERSRRFILTNSREDARRVHKKVRMRSVSLFEPRPELNHATNALCIVARRELTRHLFLDRRSFLNSYDYRIDPDGKHLLGILRAATPVCGGINLEYYFSRVDNQRLGAGSKLPHNVMGLIGVANGMEGDLRPGLPSQMIEVHTPLRLLMMVEHFPETVLRVIRELPALYEWYINGWVNLVAIHPETKAAYRFHEGHFLPYTPECRDLEKLDDPLLIAEQFDEDLPVYRLQ